MNYLLENLDPERFQTLCQALILKETPNIQCFPVGQPDGGRDAVSYVQSSKTPRSFSVFQIKFNRKPDSINDPHKWLLGIIQEEAQKIAALIPKGAKEYYLVTNVSGTSHLDSGSIDKLQEILNREIPIPARCWWRDDVLRRLDNSWDVKWSYPEIMIGTDVLRLIFESGLGDDKQRRTAAILAFLRAQFDMDSEIRFKQIELQNKLLDLFVDIPIKFGVDREEWRHVSNRDEITHRLVFERIQSWKRTGVDLDFVGAAAVLLDQDCDNLLPQMVLEGAPGQGKSTLVQYVCQVHRMKVLDLHEDLANVPDSLQPKSVRIPIKSDLRDFASWLGRKNPFLANEDEPVPTYWDYSLESFIAAQIRHQSGGINFDVADLHAVGRISSLLLVLDGLDEVADISKRADIVREVGAGVNRLRTGTASLRVVVTSRPAAFANSPGFNEKEYPHYSLDSLRAGQMIAYGERWIKAKRLDGRDARDIRSILKEKLNQPHLRDLARNPMQLTILLSLIHSLGSSLPDKRTALYDSYVERFFNREGEKSAIVKNNRDLLIAIHGHLAWILHSEAEQGRTRGNMSDERVRVLVAEYLEQEGHDKLLAEQLFTGMMERVVFLVSRIEGTFEFEVQPLREYFAGRHLYELAPYSPPGREKKGTLPDRFNATAANFYWLNVARFYAGYYSKGELPSLVQSLEELNAEENYQFIGHPRILAAMLLSDWVFAQDKRSLASAVDVAISGFRKGLSVGNRRLTSRKSTEILTLPSGAGREKLVQECIARLAETPPSDYVRELIEFLMENSSPQERVQLWRDATPAICTSDSKRRWLSIGRQLGTLRMLQYTDLEKLLPGNLTEASGLVQLLRAGQFEIIESSLLNTTSVIDYVLKGYSTGFAVSRTSDSVLERFAQIHDPGFFTLLYRYSSGSFRLSSEDERDLESIIPPLNTELKNCLLVVQESNSQFRRPR